MLGCSRLQLSMTCLLHTAPGSDSAAAGSCHSSHALPLHCARGLMHRPAVLLCLALPFCSIVQKLSCRVLKANEVHPQLFKGANRKFKKVYIYIGPGCWVEAWQGWHTPQLVRAAQCTWGAALELSNAACKVGYQQPACVANFASGVLPAHPR